MFNINPQPEGASMATRKPAADIVYYWVGGRERGTWREAFPGVWPERKTADQLVADLTRMGYVAHKGLKSIGAPEGPPSDADFTSVTPHNPFGA